ncbi:MAG: response regulator transcription factor, partial [Actinomycetales bacterium]|nr:response regulator transcription factor [Actinomycetales bacterium]
MLEVALGSEDSLTVAASCATVSDANRALATERIDVAVLDIDLPDGNGIALGVTLRRKHPDIGILLLSAHDAMDLLLDLPPDVASGWSYLSKTSSTDSHTLVRAIEVAAAGGTTLDPA